MKTAQKSALLVVAAATLWGMVGLFVRALNDAGFSGMQVVCLRSLFAAAALVPMLLFVNRRYFRVRLRDLWCFVGTGVVSLLFFNYCYFTGIETSLPVAAAMMYTSPAFLILLSALFFRERITRIKLAALCVMLVGCVLATGLLGGQARLTPEGILLGLGSGFGYALYSVFGRCALDRGYSPLTVTFYTFLFAGLGGLPLSSPASFPVLLNLRTVLLLLGLAVFCSLLPYVLYTRGLSGIETGLAGMLATVELVVSVLVGTLVLGDAMTLPVGIGIALILCGILIINLRPHRKLRLPLR